MIYLDNAASTKVHPDVLAAMVPCLADSYGNPSSIHRHGRLAKKAINKARRQVASLICADPSEIFFTSGGTESNNMALRGFALHATRSGNCKKCRIITSSIEHDAILEPCRDLQRDGLATVEYVPVDRNGIVRIDKLSSLLGCADAGCCGNDDNNNSDGDNDDDDRGGSPSGLANILESSIHDNSGTGDAAKHTMPLGRDVAGDSDDSLHAGYGATQAAQDGADAPTTLVSIMYANNEVGTIQPMSKIADMCRRCPDVILHTDAVQAAGKIPLDVASIGADMMSISSHKIYGPKGVGALYVRLGSNKRLVPRILGGGGQEAGLRSGTENVAGIMGFGYACDITRASLESNMSHIRHLRDVLVKRVLGEIPESALNGSTLDRIPGNAHFTFLGVNGEDLLIKLDEYGVEASTGSACSVNTQKASHVLEAMGFTHEQITGSLRLTLGMYNTESEINQAVDILAKVVKELRRVSPLKSKYGFDGAC